jgi:hypothetical protein
VVAESFERIHRSNPIGSGGVGNTPRQGGDCAPVAIAGQVTPHAPDRQAKSETQSASVERAGIRGARAPDRPRGGDDTTEYAAIPDQAGTPGRRGLLSPNGFHIDFQGLFPFALRRPIFSRSSRMAHLVFFSNVLKDAARLFDELSH